MLGDGLRDLLETLMANMAKFECFSLLRNNVILMIYVLTFLIRQQQDSCLIVSVYFC